jgi:hypothetical protein
MLKQRTRTSSSNLEREPCRPSCASGSTGEPRMRAVIFENLFSPGVRDRTPRQTLAERHAAALDRGHYFFRSVRRPGQSAVGPSTQLAPPCAALRGNPLLRPVETGRLQHRRIFPLYMLSIFQISLAYSRTVLSLENFPIRATFKMALRAHTAGSLNSPAAFSCASM